MNLKELFEKHTFDEILPYLKAIDPEKEDSMYQFREAFDLLRHIEPSKEDCGEVRIEWSDDEEEADRFVTVNHLAGDTWDVALAKEVVLADDLYLCKEDMAAHCLWEITFWGFKDEPDEEDEKSFSIPPESKNKYDEALYKIQLSHWKRTTPRRYRSMNYPLCTNIEYCLKRGRASKNRSKRKRDYRVECRENYLKMHSQREEFIKKLVRCGAFEREDVEYLHQVESGYYNPYISRTWDVSKRISYILESINRYQNLDFSLYDDAIICLRASLKHPVSDAEKEKLLAELPASLKSLPIKVGVGIKESLTEEVELMLFLNKKN
ncbi:MAG: hypothetical protein J5931_01415 [Prevotella sp.]|nr:hypothetical protein [Prevotella sp.]